MKNDQYRRRYLLGYPGQEKKKEEPSNLYRMCRIEERFSGTREQSGEKRIRPVEGDMAELGDHDIRKVDLKILGKGDMACLGVDSVPLCLDTTMMCH